MPRKKQGDQEKPQRRARGEGSVFQRDDDRWVARVPLGDGKRKEEYYDSRLEAERARRRMLNERDKGKLVTERDQTLESYLAYWLEAHRMTVRETTYSMHHAYLTARVIPALGDKKLRALTVDMFQRLYQEWETELSPNTIRTIHGIIRQALEDAVRWKKLPYNPAQHAKLPKARKAEISMLSNGEIERLLACAQQMKLYALFRMALLLGMRRGELLGLKWSDIDLETATLKIERTVSYMKDPKLGKHRFIVGPPKTQASKRTIHLPYDIVEVLRQHREQQSEIQNAASHWEKLDLVFCNGCGNYMDPNYVREMFDKILKAAGIEHMKFHALRHNANAILRRMKIDAVVRKEMLGHEKINMTEEVYGRATSEEHQEAALEIDRLFGRKEDKES